MKATELKEIIKNGALEKYSNIYRDLEFEKQRFLMAIDRFTEIYGEQRDIEIYSTPGRTEIAGNHTDHNHGKVLAGSITKDIIAVVSKNDDGVINFASDGYPKDKVKISDTKNAKAFKEFTSAALIAGMVNGFCEAGFTVGGYDAYSTSSVEKGSGLSSSAAFEVMVGNILNYLYNDGKIDNVKIAKIAQYSENEYYGKPCGLMDQMACAVGGMVYIDFEDSKNPIIEPIEFNLSDAGYSLCIVNTGGNHANLNDDYASVPGEMKAVAKLLGRDVLRGLCEEEIMKNVTNIRRVVGDRAVLRSIHFIRENERVTKMKEDIKCGRLKSFFSGVVASGRSSFEYLQNVYTTINVKEQGLSLALAMTEGYLSGKSAAYRVHGGGFAGTIQAYVKNKDVDGYFSLMESVFGVGSVTVLGIRPIGACKLF